MCRLWEQRGLAREGAEGECTALKATGAVWGGDGVAKLSSGEPRKKVEEFLCALPADSYSKWKLGGSNNAMGGSSHGVVKGAEIFACPRLRFDTTVRVRV